MNHDNIGTTIRELHEKVGSITFEMTKNAGSHINRDVDRSMVFYFMPVNKELRLELADVYNELGHAHKQIGSEGHANFYFMWSKYFGGGSEE